MKSYLDDFKLQFLLSGLDYLEKAALNPESLKNLAKIKIIQGQNDEIAPLSEAKAIKGVLAQAEFISVKGAGHAVFLEEDIAKYI